MNGPFIDQGNVYHYSGRAILNRVRDNSLRSYPAHAS